MNYLNRNIISLLLVVFFTSVNHAQQEVAIPASDSTQTIEKMNFELLVAASDGDTLKVKNLLEKGADVNYRIPYEGVTALMYAAQNGHLETVRILLHNGARVNLLPQNNVSALLGACMAGHVYIADTLILNGADVNTKNADGVTPLMIAAAYNDSVMADMLLFYFANKDMQDNRGNTALHFASYYGSAGVAELLIEQKANLNISDYKGFTPLMIAAQNGYSYLVDLYLQNGAIVDAKNSNSLTALSLAIINRHLETAELLIKNGADVNHNISANRNQLSLAKEYANGDMVKLLQINGAGILPAPFIDRVMINLDLNFNLDDFMMGGNIGLASLKYGIEFHGGYKTRLTDKIYLYEIEPSTYYQFWESRSVMQLGANKLFNVFKNGVQRKSGVFGGLNVCYAYGNYRGSNKKPDDLLLLVPTAGVFWYSQSFNAKFSYEYMNLRNPNVSSSRFNLSLGFNINKSKGKITLKEEPVW
jgi:ankyrin repeat protein